MHVVIGFLYILFGLAVTVGGGWVGFLLATPGEEVGSILSVGILAFLFCGMWLFFFGIDALTEKKEE